MPRSGSWKNSLPRKKKKITSRIALLAVIALCVAGVLIALLSSGNKTETPKSLSQSITVPETTVPVTTAPPETIDATTPAPTGFLSMTAGGWISAGLDADGTAVAAGRNHYGQCDIRNWSDLIAISAGDSHTVGLRADGTVVATGRNNYGQCNVSGWSGIVAIEAGYGHTVALTSDGRVAAVGRNDYGMCDVFSW